MSRPPPHLGLHHLALRVPDVAQARHFYVALLGFAVEWEPDPDNVYLTGHGDNLALHRGEATAGGLDHLGILVAEPAHVGAWEAFLRAAGVPIVATTRRHRDGATSCTVRDPAGYAVQILHHPPISPALARLAGPPAAAEAVTPAR